jgi:hypothetical protein
MSALGQERSFCPGGPNVCFAPKADISTVRPRRCTQLASGSSFLLPLSRWQYMHPLSNYGKKIFNIDRTWCFPGGLFRDLMCVPGMNISGQSNLAVLFRHVNGFGIGKTCAMKGNADEC